MSFLVLMRHGESVWNFDNRFTGSVDVPLTDTGRAEAQRAGRLLRRHRLSIDHAFSSVLQRAADSLDIVLSVLGQEHLQPHRTPLLNERDYGRLQGMDKAEAARLYGASQVHSWRRSYADGPPGGESLKDVAARLLPYFEAEIAPQLGAGKNVLIVAHEHPLRAIIMQLEKLAPAQLLELELATAVPVVYEFGPGGAIADKRILANESLQSECREKSEH
ncbi:MAG: 2,3-diphosphoglycerate-dependent phosphoglycerate mutase [Desulfurellaceae bacterium]|nr:2,3-diphosphoglycerate-dependent phosphoglycerate mutase [Desulfurellaceae bacterium]